jgi:hypothetical protein
MESQISECVTRCYNKYLNREPDDDGITTYSAFLKRRTESELISALTRSDEYKKHIHKKEFINVFMCVRNNENNLVETFSVLEKIRRKDVTYEYRYFIFENDSIDETCALCEAFMSRNHGIFMSDSLNKIQWKDVKDIGRVTDMSIYRNKCKSLCSDQNMKNSMYCVLVDTNVKFDDTILERFMNVLQDESIAMVSPFGKVGPKRVYYDTYALEFLDSPKPLRIDCGIIDVKSACGGIFMVRSDAALIATWKSIDSHRSEHNHFCYKVRDFGRIVIDTSIVTEWYK